MGTSKRKRTPAAVETAILVKSARRCPLCFHLLGDLKEKHGQIAHLDQNPSNYDEDNLAYLCMVHHSLYDSKARQHKGYTIGEVKEHRGRLYDAIACKHHLQDTHRTPSKDAIEADRRTFRDILDKLPAEALSYIRTEAFGHTFRFTGEMRFSRFLWSTSGPTHEMLDPALESLRDALRSAITNFVHILGSNTTVLRNCDQPDTDIRRFDVSQQNFRELENARRALGDAADAVCEAYDAFVREARRQLVV